MESWGVLKHEICAEAMTIVEKLKRTYIYYNFGIDTDLDVLENLELTLSYRRKFNIRIAFPWTFARITFIKTTDREIQVQHIKLLNFCAETIAANLNKSRPPLSCVHTYDKQPGKVSLKAGVARSYVRHQYDWLVNYILTRKFQSRIVELHDGVSIEFSKSVRETRAIRVGALFFLESDRGYEDTDYMVYFMTVYTWRNKNIQ